MSSEVTRPLEEGAGGPVAHRAADLQPARLMEGFFQRLAGIERLVRIIIAEAPLSARLTFRGDPPGQVRLDFGRRPARIQVGPDLPPGRIQVTIEAGVMHRVLLGETPPGEALGRREMLLRGSAWDLAQFIPLLDFAPLLYREHLADLGLPGFLRPPGGGDKGSRPWISNEPREDDSMPHAMFKGDPIPVQSLSLKEQALFRLIEEAAYAAGYGVGLLRHRLARNLSLFKVLEALSRGVEAASPARPAQEQDA